MKKSIENEKNKSNNLQIKTEGNNDLNNINMVKGIITDKEVKTEADNQEKKN